MDIPLLHCILLIVFINALKINATCQIQQNEISNEWRVIIKYENEQLKLLRELSVEYGTILYFVCNDQDITEITCENGRFNTPLPLPMCNNNLNPQLKLETNEGLCPFRIYRVGFQIHCKDEDFFFETYKVCFDHEHMRAVFTIHEAYPFVLARPQGMQFDPDEIFTMHIFASYNKYNIYARFQNLLGQEQHFMPNNAGDERFDRGHLTPVADFMTISLISTTFKMINVIPQFHTVNDGNWKIIEEWTRNTINTPSKVCSGALNYVLELPDSQGIHRQMYLRDNLIPIPSWIYKIVLNRENIRTVFLTNNNIHEQQNPPQFPYQICRPIPCPSSIYLTNSNFYGYTYCCEPEHFINTNVANLQGHC